MRSIIKLDKIEHILIKTFVMSMIVWVCTALAFQLFMVYLEVSNQEEKARTIVNAIEWKYDGTFKNDPGNIWYVNK